MFAILGWAASRAITPRRRSPFREWRETRQRSVRVRTLLCVSVFLMTLEATALNAAQAGKEDRTFIVHAGDHVGATPPASALLQDEPSISFLNLLANRHCMYRYPTNPKCNLVGTLGNHEFDEGKEELLRLLDGGNHFTGPFLEDPYRGAKFPYVCANAVRTADREPLIDPYVIKKVRGVPIAFIGAVLRQTPTIVTPTGVAGISFLDEADAINRYVVQLKAKGVRSIVVLIHQGGRQTT